MPRPERPLSSCLPPLIFGTATLNYQFNPDPFVLGPTALVQRALAHGVRAFDTSPYYGPAEEILGTALATDLVRDNYPRDQYYIQTKVGRVTDACFDYSPAWVRHSITRSCKRLRTNYLDVVYCHDVEFVTPAEVLGAVKELRQIRNNEDTVKYIGISGYPVDTLCELAEMILRETGEPLDAVMSYANLTLQNTRLLSHGLARLIAAGVSVVPNASPLGMGLLRQQGPPIGAMGNWHPAPHDLRQAVHTASKWAAQQGEKLEVVAVRFSLETWLREASAVGTLGRIPRSTNAVTESAESESNAKRIGISVMGVSKVTELDETMRIWNSVLDGLGNDLSNQGSGSMTLSDGLTDHEWSLERRQRIRELSKGIRERIGAWADHAWASPDPGFVNQKHEWNVETGASAAGKGDVKTRLTVEGDEGLLTPPDSADDWLPGDGQL